MGERRDAEYPPYVRLISLLVWGPDAVKVEADANALAEKAHAVAGPLGVTVLGPAPRAMARVRGQHRWHLLLKGNDAVKVRAVAAAALEWAEAPGRRGAKVAADVDPIETL